MPSAQAGHVALHGRLFPHFAVHGRRQQHRAGETQQQRAEQIVGQAVGGFGQQIGRGRRDAQQLATLCQLDMCSQRMLVLIERVLEHRSAGERGKRGRADELPGGGGHDHRHAGAGLHQLAHQRGGFIGRDAAADADDNLAPGHRLVRSNSGGPAPDSWPVIFNCLDESR